MQDFSLLQSICEGVVFGCTVVDNFVTRGSVAVVLVAKERGFVGRPVVSSGPV
jgi:3-oxoacyl-[acyl-carrier-protein] synthase III